MNLLVNYYGTHRQPEIDFCLKSNLANSFIKKVIVFNQHERVKHKKALNIMTDQRPTYQDFFDTTQEYQDDVNIIANSDIYFDDTIGLAKEIPQNTCYALTRHELLNGELINFETMHHKCPAQFSQDVWIFRGASTMKNCNTVIAAKTDNSGFDEVRFTLGLPGCDNVIAHKLKTVYHVKNPSNHIMCIHKHTNQTAQSYSHRVTGGFSKWGVVHQGKVPVTGL